MVEFIKNSTHPSWHNILIKAVSNFSNDYLNFLKSNNYFPTNGKIFSAFKTMPKDKVKYILFGQDPYPREQSAIGYAFIDGAVKEIFSNKGLSKEVNRATSLRNFIKMELVAHDLLNPNNTTQSEIAKIDKKGLINSIYDLKNNFEKNGVLLLNVSLVFESKEKSKYHLKIWQSFIKSLLDDINSDVKLILFGNFAKDIEKKFNPKQKTIKLEHPYNHSFINNKDAHNLFKPMKLIYI
jgi:uracil-DNA glycosylase